MGKKTDGLRCASEEVRKEGSKEARKDVSSSSFLATAMLQYPNTDARIALYWRRYILAHTGPRTYFALSKIRALPPLDLCLDGDFEGGSRPKWKRTWQKCVERDMRRLRATWADCADRDAWKMVCDGELVLPPRGGSIRAMNWGRTRSRT